MQDPYSSFNNKLSKHQQESYKKKYHALSVKAYKMQKAIEFVLDDLNSKLDPETQIILNEVLED